jgi:hypothetical protein
MGKNPSKIKITGISIPENIIAVIDEVRGDVNRSRYILRILEKALPSKVSIFDQKVAATKRGRE